MPHRFNLANISGLTEQEAAKKQKEEGYNELPSTKKRSIFIIIFEVIREPMFLLLVASGILYLFMGDVQEAIMLLGFVFVVIGITLYQEWKSERALEALRDLSSPRALVIRDRKQKRIPGKEVVNGDIIVLAEGDRVPADAVVLSCMNLSADESLLTGESVPVSKTSGEEDLQIGLPGGDNLPFVYSGSLIIQGQGIAKVKATGIHSEIGKIGKALQTLDTEDTLLQKETKKLVRNLAIFGLSLCALVIIVYGITRGNWTQGFLAGITLAMATLPEEFPVVLTIFLALGAWRISQNRVLTRRVPAIETLGSTTVLCVDKTGTLTQNHMSVNQIFSEGEFYETKLDSNEPLPERFHEAIEFSILASQRDPFDPMEIAFKELGEHYLAYTEHLHNNWTLVQEYPLSQNLLALSHVWVSPDGEDYIIAAKGAPEAIADLCHFDKKQIEDLSSNVKRISKDGLRVLGVAKASFKKVALPTIQHDFEFQFLGLVGFTDPIRPSVPLALSECYSAGIRVIMITGDYPGTAISIAKKIDLKSSEAVITGPELNNMSDEQLKERIRNVNIFARVVPQQKLHIVNALKANGEIVTMTGDGVNDAPAMKSAHIGIAMGKRGTDVARESAALVLLDDDFASIIQAVKMGRRIFDNIKKAMAYIFAIHVPIAGLSLIPVILGLPLVLLPVHIVFLELIIDPACSVVFEAELEEPNVMKRRPRNPKEPLIGRKMIGLSLLQGFSVLIIVLAVFCISLYRGQTVSDARALTVTTLIISNLSLILSNRSWVETIFSTLKRPNKALWWVMGSTIFSSLLILYIPFMRNLFHFSFLHPVDLLISFIAGVIGIIWFEFLKIFHQRKTNVGSIQ